MRADRRGFTLVELLIALVITGMVGVGLTRLLTSSQRLATTQVETALQQAMMRQGNHLLVTEIQELGSDTSGVADIIAMSDSTLDYRAYGVAGLACQVSATEVRIRNDASLLGSTGISAGRDSLLLFIEDSVETSRDDRWVALPITAVNTASSCGAASAIALSTTVLPTDLAEVKLDAMVRVYAPMRFGVVAAGGRNYLGLQQLRPVGSAMQPLAGPVAGQGVRFTYMDSTGAVTANRTRVRIIRVAVYGQTDRAVRASPGAGTVAVDTDSLVSFVTLRNTPRP